RATQGALVVGDLAVTVTGVSIDSRTLAVGEAFFAIRGHRLDGHDFVGEAASRGAACLVVHSVPDPVPAGVPLVLVEDTTKALGRLAGLHRAKLGIPVVAITGSNGKTTTKEMAAAVLASRWRVLRPESSFNNQWGLPLTLLRLTPEHEALVVEVGTNQPGEIAYLAGLTAPTVGVVTSVAAVHMQFLGSLTGVREEKAALVRALGPEGSAVLNADDARVADMARDTIARVTTFGVAQTAAVRAVGDVVETAEGLRFTVEAGGERQALRLGFVGRHNVSNALAAVAVGHVLGLSLADIARGLEAARPVKGRCVWRQADGVRILDDTYNANPASVQAALATAAAHQGGSRLVVVLGDMLELGTTSEAAHREVGRQVASAGAGLFVAMGPQMLTAVDVARQHGLAEAYHAATFEDAVAHLLKRLAAGDLVLVKGSRGMRMERIADALTARLTRGEEK
ncbi:MAG: UDP-N-acetylmuramoyl-tripeptide--D-alanyl-D-alanine ligase, partial [Candidatus Rokuibacteriota bacterium]